MLALPQAVSPVTEDIFIFFLTTLYSVLRTVLTHDTQLFVVKVMNYIFFCMWNRKMPNSWEQRVEW